MPMRIHCVHCESAINVAETLRGKSIRCPNCREVTKVPGGPQRQAPPPKPRATRMANGDGIMERGPRRGPIANPPPGRATRLGGNERKKTVLAPQQRREPPEDRAPSRRGRDDDDRGRPRSRDRYDDDSRDEPRRSKRPQKSGSKGLWIGLGVGALLVVAVIAGGTFWLVGSAQRNLAAAAKDVEKKAQETAELAKKQLEDQLEEARKKDERARAAAKKRADEAAAAGKKTKPAEEATQTKPDPKKKPAEEIAQTKPDPKKKPAEEIAQTKPDPKKKPTEEVAQTKPDPKKKPAEEIAQTKPDPKKKPAEEIAQTKPDPVKKPAEEIAQTKPDPVKKPAEEIAQTKPDPVKKPDEVTKQKPPDMGPARDPGVAFQPVPIPEGDAPAVIAPATTKKVKKATAYFKVTGNDGQTAEGSGFFAMERGLVVTNAHVVDMLKPNSKAPKKVEIVAYSGTPDALELTGTVLGADRDNDLAMVRVNGDLSKLKLPDPLPVELDQCSLTELQEVFIFGFPHGASLGKEITASKSSVSSFRRDVDGSLYQIQVNGGMHPGNSGGPVVDTRGVVVGVSVAGIRGTQLNFAVPSEKIQGMLLGRVQETALGEAFFHDKTIKLPLKVTCLDPLLRVKELKVDVWTGPSGPARRSGMKAPEQLPGDSAKQSVTVNYQQGLAAHDLILPTLSLPAGHVYWIQPMLTTHSGVRQWAASTTVDPANVTPLSRQPANLAFSTATMERTLTLSGKFEFQMQNGKQKIVESDDLNFQVLEEMVKEPRGTSLRVAMAQNVPGGFTETVGGKTKPRQAPAQTLVKRKIFVYATDNYGRLEKFSFPQFAPPPFKFNPKSKVRPPPPPSIEKQIMWAEAEDMAGMFNTTYQLASLNVPNRSVQPLEVWDAKIALLIRRGKRTTTIDVVMKYTYEGSRTVNGKTEALITITGEVERRKNPNDKNEVSLDRPKSRIVGKGTFDVAGGYFSKLKVAIRDDFEFAGTPVSHIFEVNLARAAGNKHNIVLPARNPTTNPPAFAGERKVWRYNSGGKSYDIVNESGKRWVEVKGKDTNVFEEVARNDDYVELKDVKRPLSIRLYSNVSEFKGGNQKEWSRLFDGNWIDPKAASNPASGNPGGNPGADDKGLTLLKPAGRQQRETYRDVAPDGGILIGFQAGGKPMSSVRPIYLTKDGEKMGNLFGSGANPVIIVKAKPGYVVGQITVRSGGGLDGMSVKFVKFDKDKGRVDPSDSYNSDWIGGTGGSRTETVGQDGQFFIGIHGHKNGPNGNPTSLGLIVKQDGKQSSTKADSPSAEQVPVKQAAEPAKAAEPVKPVAPAAAGGQAQAVGQTLALKANHAVYDHERKLLYVSVSSTSPEKGNTVCAINPKTGKVEWSVNVGSDPGVLALSEKSKKLWIGLKGAACIQAVDLDRREAGPLLGLGNGNQRPVFAESMVVQAGTTDTVIVSLCFKGGSPRHAGVAVYDLGLPRQGKSPGHTGANRITLGETPNLIYGYNNETTEFGLRQLTVDANGISQTKVTQRAVSGFGVDIAFADGKIYATSGAVVDGPTGTLVGTIPAKGPMAVAADGKRVYFLVNGTIKAFDTATLAEKGSFAASWTKAKNSRGTGRGLTLLGDNGFAIIADNQVILVPMNMLQEKN